jgi:hypothetical protein
MPFKDAVGAWITFRMKRMLSPAVVPLPYSTNPRMLNDVGGTAKVCRRFRGLLVEVPTNSADGTRVQGSELAGKDSSVDARSSTTLSRTYASLMEMRPIKLTAATE